MVQNIYANISRFTVHYMLYFAHLAYSQELFHKKIVVAVCKFKKYCNFLFVSLILPMQYQGCSSESWFWWFRI